MLNMCSITGLVSLNKRYRDCKIQLMTHLWCCPVWGSIVTIIHRLRCCRLPIIADGTTAPMPQEASTVNLIVKSGAAVLLKRTSDIVPVVRRMIDDSKHYAAMRAATITIAIPNATRRIVEEITALIPVPAKVEESLPAPEQLTESALA